MGYYAQFPMPIPHLGVRSIVLLTLPPLTLAGPFDLHALATPPAFNLSQNQTLHLFSVVVPEGTMLSSKEALNRLTIASRWPVRGPPKRDRDRRPG